MKRVAAITLTAILVIALGIVVWQLLAALSTQTQLISSRALKQTEIAKLEAELSTSQQDVSKIVGNLSDAMDTIEKKDGELDNQAEEIDQLETGIETLESEINTLNRDIESLNGEIDILIDEVNDLKHEKGMLKVNYEGQLDELEGILMCEESPINVDYENNKTVSDSLVKFVNSWKGAEEPISSHRWSLIWTKSKYSIHTIEVHSEKDSINYVWKFTSYFNGEGNGRHVNGIFWADHQCWLDFDK